MAQLNSRGTLIRGRWDYFEQSNGIANVWGLVSSGPIGAYLVNNSTGGTALDIYNLSWTATVATVVEVAFFLPPLTLVPVAPSESYIHPLQPDAAAPPGALGMFSTFTNVFWTIVRYSNTATADELTPIPGSYFATLPPGWAIAVWTAPQASQCELSMSCWYQYVTDNISPAN